MQVIDLMEQVKTKAGWKSDYELAKKFGMSTARVSEWRTGKRKPDVYACTKMALILEVEPIEIIAEIEAETEKNEDKKEFWRSFRSHIGKAAMIMLAIGCTLSSPNEAQAGGKTETIHNCILCKIRRSIKKLINRFGGFFTSEKSGLHEGVRTD